jgi:hypothetical protein
LNCFDNPPDFFFFQSQNEKKPVDKTRKVCRTEAKIQEEVEDKLRLLKWYVISTHGNIYQHGLPDIYCGHLKYGTRWLEIKNPDGYSFTPSQMENFQLMSAAGIGIWIATSAIQVPDVLFAPPNWYTYLAAFSAGGRRG